MARVSLSNLFNTNVLAKAFDDACNDRAAKGATYAPLLNALHESFGLEIPAATRAAIVYLNGALFKQDTAPKLVTGEGAKASVVALTFAMHQYATVLREGVNEDKRAHVAEVAALPDWADPAKIEAAKQAKQAEKKRKADEEAAKALAEKAAKEAAQAAALASVRDSIAAQTTGKDAVPVSLDASPFDGAPGSELPADITAAPVQDTRSKALAAWAVFAAYLNDGVFTAFERDNMLEAIEKMVTRADDTARDVTADPVIVNGVAQEPALV